MPQFHRILILTLSLSAALAAQGWAPADNPLMTRWAADVSPSNALPEYPRPQMTRDAWLNLNGLWNYAIVDRGSPAPQSYQGEILVPFAAESALSGVKKSVGESKELWYRRTFEIPSGWRGQHVLLHFGAVDWQAIVWVNGFQMGMHRGGYTPFSFDITDALTDAGEQEIVVDVWDPSDAGTQPRGKQVREPEGIWYTAVTGIWQTVWLEPVPETAIESLKITPDVDGARALVRVNPTRAAPSARVRVTVNDGGDQVGQAEGAAGEEIAVDISQPKLWSPDSPHLYDLDVALLEGGAAVDRVGSYLGMRKISLGRGKLGFERLLLNNKPLFELGPLDQGWWPDGLYTAPTDEALRSDIEVTKKLGFNMARKHVKVEPARWYYWCDKLGLLVWQDMPSGYMGRVPGGLFVDPTDAEDASREGVSQAEWQTEYREMLDALHNQPSIVMWVPFNEGWGQYDTARIAAWTKAYDPSRLVDSVSGWTDRGVGDVLDIHIYPGPGIEMPQNDRAAVLGEFGGLGWPVEGRLWWNKRNWGYRTYHSREELNEQYQRIVGSAVSLPGRGLAAAIYTQTTDVEGEVNGLMTYDRSVIKFDEAALNKLHDRLYADPKPVRWLFKTSADQWSYSTTAPADGWRDPDFAAPWQTGAAPFQAGGDSLFKTGTVWKDSSDIWLRREFQLDSVPGNLWADIYHDADAGELYLNGKLILDLADERPVRRHYQTLDLSRFADALRAGKNVVAFHGKKAAGQRGFDIGVYTVE